ncbi:MAG: amidase, partial [Alphaproteobacteria bacterium]|nr:amidase [Alphaproteobacteria bacterium]
DPRDRHSIPDEGVGWIEAARADLPRGLRIAFCVTWADAPVDAEVRDITAAAVRRFECDLGCVVEATASPFGDLIEADRAIVALETDLRGLRQLANGRESDLSPPLRGLLRRTWTAEEFTDAITARKAGANAMARFMERYDLLLTPTAPIRAFAINHDGPGSIDGVPVADDSWSPCLYPANLTGQPAASVPAGFTSAGLPVGLQIVGRHLGDRLVLTAAAAIERLQSWTGRRPPVHL